MELQAPKVFTDLLPDALHGYSLLILGAIVLVVGLVALLALGLIVRLLFGGNKRKPGDPKNLKENLNEYPELKAGVGDRQLRAEGIPVRLRLVVIAPAGASEVEVEELEKVLEEVVTGLGGIYKNDKPRVKVWPRQVSYQGFANHFQANMETGAADHEQTRWILLAGRAKVGKKQFMLGLGMQSIKPNTIGRRTLDAHEWSSALRVRVRD